MDILHHPEAIIYTIQIRLLFSLLTHDLVTVDDAAYVHSKNERRRDGRAILDDLSKFSLIVSHCSAMVLM